jgi:hypothetical protein
MRPCKECQKNKWNYRFFDDTRIVRATCLKCGSVVEFKAKPRKPYNPNKIHAKAEYMIMDDKRFLKIDGGFKEVGLYKFGNYLRVCPVENIVIDREIMGKKIL